MGRRRVGLDNPLKPWMGTGTGHVVTDDPIGGGVTLVATVHGTIEQKIRRERWIEAVPDLYEVCLAVLELNPEPDGVLGGADRTYCRAVQQLARAALLKAKGPK